MPEVKCPVCGELNSADQEFCQYCQSRLHPLTGPLKGADAPIQPGDVPTKKGTAELEPILPQWLREARDKARKTAEEEAAQAARTVQPGSKGPDLLAGLQSQHTEEETETPDWLANITGAAPSKKPAAHEPTEAHWVELGGPEEFSPEGVSGAASSEPPSGIAAGRGLPSWVSGAVSSEVAEEDQTGQPTQVEPEAGGATEAPGETSDVVPEWLLKLKAEQAAAASSEPAPDEEWPKGLQAQTEAPAPPADSRPDSLPGWLGEQAHASAKVEPVEADLPDWLKAAAPKSTFDEPLPQEKPAAAKPLDWLASAGGEARSEIEDRGSAAAPGDSVQTQDAGTKPEEKSTPAFALESLTEGARPAAFTEEALTAGDMDALFGDMPDWLARVSAQETPAEDRPGGAGTDEVSQVELPTWVQAMRPVESSISQPVTGQPTDLTLETRGALAGLQGVLPAVPGAEPTSKPRAHSIKLQATDEQQAHAALLDQILEAEAAPEPIASFRPMAAHRLLRWAIAGLLFLAVTGALLVRSQVFRLPVAWPVESMAALQVVEAIPQAAPVLVVVDYEPARAGEVETAAAALLDHMILLRQPRLTFLSTSPAGPLLSERLMAGPLGGHAYQRGLQYANLGYLPGGFAGVLAFVQNPRAAKPFDFGNTAAWESVPLQGVQALSNFAALTILTDNTDIARIWIEQAGFYRGAAPLLIVSSAQAAPMIQPYYQSQQISGLVSGLQGAAVLEQNNAGRPGTARTYWDAYNLGLFMATLLMVAGGLWNFALGLRERAASRAQ